MFQCVRTSTRSYRHLVNSCFPFLSRNIRWGMPRLIHDLFVRMRVQKRPRCLRIGTEVQGSRAVVPLRLYTWPSSQQYLDNVYMP